MLVKSNGANGSAPPRVDAPSAPCTQHGSPNGNAGPYTVVHDGRPIARLEETLKAVISALHAAQQHAKAIGFAMPAYSAYEINRMVEIMMAGRK